MHWIHALESHHNEQRHQQQQRIAVSVRMSSYAAGMPAPKLRLFFRSAAHGRMDTCISTSVRSSDHTQRIVIAMHKVVWCACVLGAPAGGGSAQASARALQRPSARARPRGARARGSRLGRPVCRPGAALPTCRAQAPSLRTGSTCSAWDSWRMPRQAWSKALAGAYDNVWTVTVTSSMGARAGLPAASACRHSRIACKVEGEQGAAMWPRHPTCP